MFPLSVPLHCFCQRFMGELSACLLTLLPWTLCPRATIKVEELTRRMGQTASDGVVDFFLHQQHVQERLNRRQAGVEELSPAGMTHCHSVSLLFLLFR